MRIITINIRCIIRLTRLALHFSVGIFKSSLLRIKYGPQWYYNEIGSESIQEWMKKICHIIGLKIRVSGGLFHPTVSLIVANHISWLDIVALSSSVKSSFISKNELKKWPIIGSLAIKSGTIFIKRNNRNELNSTINTVTNVLKNGKSVILFPEGTTTNGISIKKFNSALFQSAINSKVNIQPVTIRYLRNEKRDNLAPYIDKNNFVFHLLRIMSQKKTVVCLYINRIITPSNESRQKLTSKSQIQIALTLNQN